MHPQAVASMIAVMTATAPRVHAKHETMRIGAASIHRSGPSYKLALDVGDDNDNPHLPPSYRRWWHAEITGLAEMRPRRLHIELRNCGYDDVILPVWSQSRDGQSFAPYQRMPLSAMPTRTGQSMRLSLEVPEGVQALRIAKYFPWSVQDCQEWIAGLQSRPGLRRTTTLGETAQGRPIQLLEITGEDAPDSHKHRVWVQAGVHPGETPSYFVMQGLVEWLLSGSAAAKRARQQLLLDVVPMVCPDGVALGNYRCNSRSVNSEIEWAHPYDCPEAEVASLRQAIEERMGTPTAPAPKPIEVLLNLHATHDHCFPLHFQHEANPGFDLNKSRRGVLPAVHAQEQRWIEALARRSPWMRCGTVLSSTAGDPQRPYLESMLHDRWSANPSWRDPERGLPQPMAITFEASYGKGPDRRRWNSIEDGKELGAAMGRALLDYFGIPQQGSE